MKSKTRSKIWAILGTLVMILPFFLGLGSVKTNAEDANVDKVPKNVNVTIHKTNGGNPANGDITPGTGEGVEGAEFVGYDITSIFYKNYKIYKENKPDGTLDEFIKQVAQDEATYATGKEISFEKTDKDGNSKTVTLAQKTGEHYNVYFIKEKSFPAGAVQKAVPLVLVLPTANSLKDPNITLNAKNEIRTKDIEFTKVGNDGKALANANFALYNSKDEIYNIKDGKFEARPLIIITLLLQMKKDLFL